MIEQQLLKNINILRTNQKSKVGGFDFANQISNDAVAIAISPKTRKFVVRKFNGDESIMLSDKDKASFYPLVPLKRFTCIFSGASGGGKTLTASGMLRIYHEIYPNRRILFVSPNRLEDDISLNKLSFIQQVPVEVFERKQSDPRIFQDTLILVDDCDDEGKGLFTTVNKIVNIGRKYNSSIIFITHKNSAKQKSTIYSEADMYICFHRNLRNNTFLNNNDVSEQQIQHLHKLKSIFYCFNFVSDAVITDTTVENIEYK